MCGSEESEYAAEHVPCQSVASSLRTTGHEEVKILQEWVQYSLH